MKYVVSIGLLTLVLVGGGCFFKGENKDNQNTTPEIDRDAILFEARENGLIMDEGEVARMTQIEVSADPTGSVAEPVDAYLKMDFKGWAAAALADVTGGGSFGIARTRFLNGKFILVAELGNLPDPQLGYSYQGWLVRRGEQMDAVSAGIPVKTDKGNAIVYLSSQDFTAHDFFVLTLEPDDGNPSPAGHILEGEIK